MSRSCSLFVFFVFFVFFRLIGTAAPAAEAELPPADKEPLLRVDAGGPIAFVTALAFSPDGKTLYAGGWDKVIRAWTQDDKGIFQRSPLTYRVPVGPGLNGAINALALSPNGDWLAAAGSGMARQIAGFQQLGFIVPSFGARDDAMLRDVGTIYLFNTRDRSVRMLRGHRGYVTTLTFGPQRGKDIPPLLSVAVEEKPGNTVQTQRTARLWDANKGETIAELTGLPSKEDTNWLLPEAALWQNEEGGGTLRAALALYDGNLRLWEPARDRVRPQVIEDLRFNLTVTHLGRGRLLTAGYDGNAKQWLLARWRVPAKGQPEREQWTALGSGFPRALALLSRKADGVTDLAAVLAMVSGPKNAPPHQYRLRLADLGGEKLRVLSDIALWRDMEVRQPPLATSLRGRHVAVANNADHTIHVYALGDLLGDQPPAPQILRGGTAFFRQASFVRRGKDLGLRLKRDPKGDWVFDFAKRRLSDDLADWRPASPKAGTWDAKLAAKGRRLLVTEGEKLKATINIADRETYTTHALFAPAEAEKMPLLAVATHKNGEPKLALYNAKSGEELREFTGHTERLRSVAFAPDGRLLVSAADDGTVCVWSLTDLPTIVGQHGRLPGVIVGPADKGSKAVKVLQVQGDSPVRGKLQEGDVLAGLVQQGELRSFDSPRSFYEALYQIRPGAEVTLRRGDPKGKDDIRLRVGQGIDERKPLFSLFVIGGAKASDCEWIGWTPIGPYEASSPRAEKYLGWHFNTGDPNAPTRFADAGQYRKFYYRENLLNQLIERGALGQVELPRLPPPVLGVWEEDEERALPRAEQDTVIVRRPRVDLTVALFERPLSSLSALTWQLDGGTENKLNLEQRGEASFQVSVPPLSRGEHRFVVTARTRDRSLEPTRKLVVLRYQPLPPEVTIKEADQQRLVRQADFTLEASIQPKVSGENVLVTIRHRHEEGDEKHTQTLAGRDIREGASVPLQQRLKLRPGNNEVEVSAVNGGAVAGTTEPETSRKKISVFYYFEAKPPVITFLQVVPEDEKARPIDLSQPMVVRRPVVTVIGKIQAEDEPLTEAQWDRGKTTKAARLNQFEAGKQKNFSFKERIKLQPGRQTFRFHARTKNGKKDGENNLELIYQPPVPIVTGITAPLDGTVLEGDKDQTTVRVRGRVRLVPEAKDYKKAILVNGKPASPAPELDEKTGILSGDAVLNPGENRIQMAVENEWGASSSSEVIVVHYIRPPVLAGKPTHEPVAGTSLVNLTVPVLSPAPLERESVRVEVNGSEATPQKVQIDKGQANRWTVHLQSVPLDAGSREQQLVVHLANSEAPCRKPAVLTIRSEKVLPAPDAEFVGPRRDTSVSEPEATIRFQVRSQGKLEAIRLLREGSAPLVFDPSGARRVGEKYELTASAKVELKPGENRLSLEAVSVSGRLPASPRLILTYTPPPLRIAIDALTVRSRDGVAVKPQRPEQGLLLFPEAASGQVWLHGRVLWTDKGENWREDYFLLHAFVNGFQQKPFRVQREENAAETKFQIQLLLNRPKGNRIRLVASRQDAGNATESLVDCAEPITAQRLHVLALSPYSQPDEVKKRIEEATANLQSPKGGRASAFQKVNILPPLTGHRVHPNHLCSRLQSLQQQILRFQRDDRYRGSRMNEVLMIYYEGGEKIDKKGHFFETYSPIGEGAFDMPCDRLAGYLETVPGAHVLLLDVDRSERGRQDPGRDKIERWEDNFPQAHSHVVVMRCARHAEPGRRSAVRLIPVLQKQIPQAARLSKLIELIDEALRTSNDGNLLVFTKYLPPELANLPFGPVLP